MLKLNIFDEASKAELNSFKIEDRKNFDLSPLNHKNNQEKWHLLYKNNPNLARKIIQAQTLNYLDEHPKLKPSPAILEEFSESVLNLPPPIDKTVHQPMKISVIASDCLKVAQDIVATGEKVLVLNMANQFNRGGGYKEGMGSQEEDLFRRTNLNNSLTEDHYPHDEKLPFDQRGFGEFNAIYSGEVTVLRKGCNQNYAFLDEKEQFSISVISSAAYNLNHSQTKYNFKAYLEGMERKIIMQFETALKYGHRQLVFSAFGCGAFNGNPIIVAKLYKKVLEMPRYQNAFDEVIFAIVRNPGCDKDNYVPFEQVFEGKVPTPTPPFQRAKNALFNFIEFPAKHPKTLGLGAFLAIGFCYGTFWGLPISLALTMGLQLRNVLHDRYERSFTKENPKIEKVVIDSPYADGLRAANSWPFYLRTYFSKRDWQEYPKFAAGFESAYKEKQKQALTP